MIEAGNFVTYLGSMLALVCATNGTRVQLLVQSTARWHVAEVDIDHCTEGDLDRGKDILDATVTMDSGSGRVASIVIGLAQEREPYITIHLPDYRLSGPQPLSSIIEIKFK